MNIGRGGRIRRRTGGGAQDEAEFGGREQREGDDDAQAMAEAGCDPDGNADGLTAAAAAGIPAAEGAGSRRGPLADDVTPAELAAKQKKPKNGGRAASAQGQYDKSGKKWWKKFCAYAQWDEKAKLNFLDADGEPLDGTFRQFFIYMYEQDATKHQWKAVQAWAQALLNEQREGLLKGALPAHICNLAGVRERKDEIFSNARWEHMEYMVDLQAEIESDIGTEKMLEMVTECLNMKIPETGPMFCMQARRSHTTLGRPLLASSRVYALAH